MRMSHRTQIQTTISRGQTVPQEQKKRRKQAKGGKLKKVALERPLRQEFPEAYHLPSPTSKNHGGKAKNKSKPRMSI